jgi:hypothetical protein
MGALDPIAGISLERYAELAAAMKDCGGDLEVCARIAAEKGVDRSSWQQAMDGWNERMANPATAGQVAIAYMPLYQAALAKTGDVATASFEDYAGMIVMLNHKRFGLDAMYAHYGIDVHKWSQISTYWVNKLTTDQQLSTRFGSLTNGLRQQLDEGGPPPVPGQGDSPQQVSGTDLTEAASAITSLPPVAVGENCFIKWSDGQKYPGFVAEAGEGKCLINFPNGRSEWIENQYITNE